MLTSIRVLGKNMMSSDISSWGFTWKVEQICAKDSQDGADLGGKKKQMT